MATLSREITLPWPPSVNHYYRRTPAGVLISREGRAYRAIVSGYLATYGLKETGAKVAVMIDLYPPDKRRRDIDNVLKALLDALQHGGLYKDDSQIIGLAVVKCDPVKDGQVVLKIQEVKSWSKLQTLFLRLWGLLKK